MPRRKHSYLEKRSPSMSGLASTLAEELKSNKESGQPMIDEREFETGAIRVNVIWDEWENIPHETRTETILRAYEQVEGKEYEKRIALAIGLTVPEAYSSGLLPYQVIPLLRQ